MAITPGTRLGPYEMLSPLGAGGMGEVWRARDTRLGREVAIKALPENFAHEPERLARFEREARLLASLQHPRIAVVYGLEESDGRRFLIMELVPGESLTERLAGDGVSLGDALEIARQIAEGLEAAHEKGIIHRDLKPSNVQIGPDGSVKLLDFGLAKAFEGTPSGEGADAISRSPTISEQMTGIGIILGTAAYMSPEQARGRPVDRRSDVWSFGVVFFEMLSGRRLFVGETVSDTLAAVLRADPDWNLLPKETPSVVRRLLGRCLERDPKQRLHDIGDARLEIEEVIAERRTGSSISGVLPAAHAAPAPSRRPLVFAAAAVAGLVLAFVAGWRVARSRTPRAAMATAPIHSVVVLPPGTRLAGWASPVVALSRDGCKLAFIAAKEGSLQQLYVHHLDRGDTQLVPDSETAEGPFFSPDGDWIAFATDVSAMRARAGQLKKFSLSTGLTQSICGLLDYFGGDWSQDGSIYFVGEEHKGICKVPAGGGIPVAVAPSIRIRGRDEPHGILWPQRLGETRLLVSDEDSSRWGDVGLLDLASRELKYLVPSALSGRYAPSGHLLYLDAEGTLFAVPFDSERGQTTGAPVAAVKDVTIASNLSGAFAVSDSGSLVYATGYLRDSGRELLRLVRIDRAGSVQPLGLEDGTFGRAVRVSPDGRRVAAVTWDYTLWIYDLRRNSRLRLPNARVRVNDYPAWTPDGERVAFGGDAEGTPGWKIFWQKADGSAEPELLVGKGFAERHPGSFASDGRALLYDSFGEGEELGIWVQKIGEKSEPRRLLAGPVRQPMASPGGRWLAYASGESGALEVYAEEFPQLGHKVQISIGGGTYPVWSRDGREIFYRRGDGFYAVSIAEGPELAVGAPKLLFEKAGIRGYDVTPDGRGFIAVFRPPDSGIIRELHLVTNWFEELERLVPGGTRR